MPSSAHEDPASVRGDRHRPVTTALTLVAAWAEESSLHHGTTTTRVCATSEVPSE